MDRLCVDCNRDIGINDDPTDGRCQDCDFAHLNRPVSKRSKGGKSDERAPTPRRKPRR